MELQGPTRARPWLLAAPAAPHLSPPVGKPCARTSHPPARGSRARTSRSRRGRQVRGRGSGRSKTLTAAPQRGGWVPSAVRAHVRLGGPPFTLGLAARGGRLADRGKGGRQSAFGSRLSLRARVGDAALRSATDSQRHGQLKRSNTAVVEGGLGSLGNWRWTLRGAGGSEGRRTRLGREDGGVVDAPFSPSCPRA